MDGNKTILLVEDDAIDVMTIRRAIKQVKIANPMTVASNGEEALDYLRDPAHERPGIILLDLNMPRMNGIEFLRIIKADDFLRSIPVIVLTTSREDQDRMESFNLSVAGYMVKPVDYAQFVEMMKTIHGYWTTSELPG